MNHRPVTIKVLTAEQAAYIAGILDGEGSITISKKNDHTGMRRGVCYRPCVSVANTNELLLLWLQATTGLGGISSKAPSNPRHRQAWKWSVWSQQARQLLEVVSPYLLLKREQAELVLDFVRSQRRGVGRDGLSEEEWSRQADTHGKLLQLNKRGA